MRCYGRDTSTEAYAMTSRIPVVTALAVLAACGGNASPVPTGARAVNFAARWIPAPGSSYQIQYDGKLDLHVPAAIFDLDMFDTPASVVAKLHAMGRRVMCYVDVGTWERWRPDADKFPKSVLGRRDGRWVGERWLDIRQTAILEPIMGDRFDLCKRKGFDGVDPDNLDGYENRTGFPLTYAQQLTYDTWVAQAVHARGLTVDQKGDNDQVKDLVKIYDFAVVEQCYAQGWCDQFAVYTKTNRLVVDVEYGLPREEFAKKTCPDAARYDETAILKKLELTAWIVTCPRR
jgi:hypothetical protein